MVTAFLVKKYAQEFEQKHGRLLREAHKGLEKDRLLLQDKLEKFEQDQARTLEEAREELERSRCRLEQEIKASDETRDRALEEALERCRSATLEEARKKFDRTFGKVAQAKTDRHIAQLEQKCRQNFQDLFVSRTHLFNTLEGVYATSSVRAPQVKPLPPERAPKNERGGYDCFLYATIEGNVHAGSGCASRAVRPEVLALSQEQLKVICCKYHPSEGERMGFPHRRWPKLTLCCKCWEVS